MRHLQQQIPHTKILLPTAPVRPLTISLGAMTTSWFDILSLHPEGPEDRDGIQAALDQVVGLVRGEMALGIPAGRIFIGGFCIGGALAFHAALRSEQLLGGAVVLSGWLLEQDAYPNALRAQGLPVLCCHGEHDATVLIGFTQRAVELLEEWGVGSEFEALPSLGHTTSKEEFEIVGSWLQALVREAEPCDPPGSVPADLPSAPETCASDLKQQASAAIADGDVPRAIALYTQAIAQADPSPLLYANRAAAFMKAQPPRVNEAVQDCTQALELNPDSAKALKTRGKAYAAVGKWDLAVKDLRLGQQIDYDEDSAEVAREAEQQFAEASSGQPKPKNPTEGEGEAQGGKQVPTNTSASPGVPPPAEFMQSLLGDPELMRAMQDPEIAPKLQDIVTAVMTNPMQAMGTVMEYVNDPKLGPLIMKLMGKFDEHAWTCIDEVD
eukprot:TRINITY_DN20050_c0_g1_i3.p1 TRINITY_DN20050_c0_g1~~TRINITY_DN20050_c0_g1_i3.p1  ORF type:complete len:439 (+),score=113.14 TRINITY_DN20050_c0_g1_i3:193-1509(+)